jgi:hypothetical protein
MLLANVIATSVNHLPRVPTTADQSASSVAEVYEPAAVITVALSARPAAGVDSTTIS